MASENRDHRGSSASANFVAVMVTIGFALGFIYIGRPGIGLVIILTTMAIFIMKEFSRELETL